jgi:hypothetical protein
MEIAHLGGTFDRGTLLPDANGPMPDLEVSGFPTTHPAVSQQISERSTLGLVDHLPADLWIHSAVSWSPVEASSVSVATLPKNRFVISPEREREPTVEVFAACLPLSKLPMDPEVPFAIDEANKPTREVVLLEDLVERVETHPFHP